MKEDEVGTDRQEVWRKSKEEICGCGDRGDEFRWQQMSSSSLRQAEIKSDFYIYGDTTIPRSGPFRIKATTDATGNKKQH